MKNRGDIIVSVLVFAAIAMTMVIGLTSWGATTLANIRNLAAREQAFQIAEAGINYYQWHLAQKSPNAITRTARTMRARTSTIFMIRTAISWAHTRLRSRLRSPDRPS